jgi:hypothetical protein
MEEGEGVLIFWFGVLITAPAANLHYNILEK